MTVDQIRIEVTAEVTAAMAKLNQLEKTAKENQSSFQKLSSTFSTMRDVMQGPIAAVNLAISAFNKVKGASDMMERAFAESEQTAAILHSTIKATGGAAGLTASEIQDLASEFQNMTKYEDDAVLSMENVLLGFKNIKGDNFKSASLEVLNMATVMGMDLTSAAQAVGKALDNPAKGLDSLSRQGFKFTDAEKAMMVSMQDAGNIAGAQKIILDELAETYGGAAEAAGGASSALKDKLANAMDTVHEEVGRGITTRLAPFRERWLEIAKAVGASAKAQNDFNDAMKNMKGGVATVTDQITIAEGKIRKLKEDMAYDKTGGEAGDKPYLEQIAAQETLLSGLKEQVRINDLYKTRTDEIARVEKEKADAAAASAKRNADAIELVANAQKKVTDAINAAALSSQYLGTGMLSNKDMADLYGGAIVEILSDTRGLVSESNKLLDPLKKAMQTYGMAAEEIDAWLAGVEEWVVAGDAQNAAIEKAAKGTREAQAAMDAYNQSASKAINYVVTLTEVQQAQVNAAMSGYQSMAEALGGALVSGEDGWKAFGRAGLNAVASVVEAMALESDALIASTLAKIMLGQVWQAPGLGAAIAASAAAHGAAGAIRAIPMAEGGSGIVTKPTLFLAGEAGPEPFAFGGANNKRGMGMGGGNTYNTVVQNIGGSVIAERKVKQLAMSGMAQATRGY